MCLTKQLLENNLGLLENFLWLPQIKTATNPTGLIPEKKDTLKQTFFPQLDNNALCITLNLHCKGIQKLAGYTILQTYVLYIHVTHLYIHLHSTCLNICTVHFLKGKK